MNWIESWVTFRDANTFASSAVVWFAHALILVLFAWLCAEVLAKRFSRTRYRIWIVTCCSLLLLASVSLLSVAIPIGLEILPQTSLEAENSDSVTASNEPLSTMFLPNESFVVETESIPDADLKPNVSSDPSATITRELASVSSDANAQQIEPANSLMVFDASLMVFGARTAIVFVYAIGLSFSLLRIVVGQARLASMRRRSVRLDASAMLVASECASEMGLRSCPDCLQSVDATVPMVTGIFRQAIILPVGFQQHQSNIQRHCLLHEMAHVDHHDGLWNLLGEIMAAFYWFHPAALLARGKLRQSREYAADDRVLRHCVSNIAYSKTLLQLAQLVGKNHNQSLGISAATQVERRIRRVVKPDFQTRQIPGWLTLFPAVLIIAISLCVIQLDRAVGQPPPAIDNTDTDATAEEIAITEPAGVPAASVGDAEDLSVPDFEVKPIAPLRVLVVDPNNRPIANADVRARHLYRYRDPRDVVSTVHGDLAPAAVTDSQGRCELKLNRSTWKNGTISVHKAVIPDDATSNSDIQIQSGGLTLDPSDTSVIKVVIRDHVAIRGKVLVDGKPIPGLRVGLATRTENNGPFNKYYNGFFETKNGEFEFKAERTGEYAIMLYLPETSSSRERTYFHQSPIPTQSTGPRNVGTINVAASRLKEKPQ